MSEAWFGAAMVADDPASLVCAGSRGPSLVGDDRVNAPVAAPNDIVERVRALCLALPETTARVDRWAHSFDIRRRSFCLLLAVEDPNDTPIPLLVLRAEPHEREALVASGHPFLASTSPRDRLGVLLTDDVDWEEIRELVTDSYRTLAPKKLIALLD